MTDGFFPVNQDNVDRQAGVQPFVFLKEGVTQVRVLPPYSAQGVWAREVREHQATIDGKYMTFTCPKYHQDSKCPFCEEGASLHEEGTEESVEDSKAFRPKRSFLFNVLVYSAPGDLSLRNGVKVLKTGITVQRQIFDLDQDAAGGWGNIYDLAAGFDLRITAKGAGRQREYIVKGVPGRTDIQASLSKQGISIALKPVDLDELLPCLPYDRLKSALNDSRRTGNQVPSAPPAAQVGLSTPGVSSGKMAPPSGSVPF